VPWARRHAGFTSSFENTIAWLATQTSKAAVTQYMRIAWRTVGSILTRVMEERREAGGKRPVLRRIGVDDKSYRRGQRYITLVVDHDRGCLVWAARGRSARVLREFFDMIGEEAASQIELVSRDVGPWITIVLDERCPGAVQCMDPFHVVAWATEAVELTRRDQARSFRSAGMGRRSRYVKGTRWIVRTGMEHLSDGQRAGLEDLAVLNEPLYRAYLLKEQLRSAFREGGASGCALISAWIGWAADSGLPHMVEVARRVATHIDAIHAALQHRLSNARTEAFNTRLQLINRRAYGFHSAEALIALAMLDLGKLCPPLPGRTEPTHDYVT
jgi:transposase